MDPLKVCLVSSEVAPFAKTGGLADVSAALARHLQKRKHDVRLFMPLYRRTKREHELTPVPELQDIAMRCGERTYYFSISTAKLPKSPFKVWFVRCPELYDREGIYTQDQDEHIRFALLSRAALEVCQWTQWAPDIVHANDWHTALLPLYLRTLYAWDKLFARTRTVLTIHNIGYQGIVAADKLRDLGLEAEKRFLYQEDLNEGRINFLKTGILYAHALTTVSRTYAQEIQGDEHGMGLQHLLRQRTENLFGIVNGVDYEEWNPRKDPLIPERYSERDLRGKEACKQALCEKLGIGYDARAPLIGVVSRLTAQKGFELLPDILPVLLHRADLRLVVLGNGEERYENYFNWLAGAFPKKVAFRAGFDNALAHWIEAASDMFLMPSRYEPCGLNQMYSLRYGSVPIVRRTGGLADTVAPWNAATGEGTGFLFDDFTPEALFGTLQAALELWRDEGAWQRLVQNGMAQDFSWEHQIGQYIELYQRLVPPR
ncbi:MAG: glycogen synthase GlgA [Planctomycetes bacterium]|nr:glycogen synthase GlgA [Planctomycetota bacterium]